MPTSSMARRRSAGWCPFCAAVPAARSSGVCRGTTRPTRRTWIGCDMHPGFTGPHDGPPHGRRGFTLVELLLVLGALTSLAALILPAMGAARDQAPRCACTVNQALFAGHHRVAGFQGAIRSCQPGAGSVHCVAGGDDRCDRVVDGLANARGVRLGGVPEPPPRPRVQRNSTPGSASDAGGSRGSPSA